MSTDRPTSPDTIVLIHGLWMTPLSWEHWIERYTARGYNVLAPAWPGMDVDIEQLRADPSAIEHLGIAEIVDHDRKSAAVTEYNEFEARSHSIIGQDGWEEVADYALDWAAEHAAAKATSAGAR
jgi:hypothetical protein